MDMCQSRMKCLRERYCREKKSTVIECRSGAKAPTKEPWPLMVALNFLNDHIRPRQTYTNFDVHTAEQEVLGANDTQPIEDSTEATNFDRYVLKFSKIYFVW